MTVTGLPAVAGSTVTLSPAAAGSGSVWAFGAERSVSTGWQTSLSGNSTYSLNATFGWHTILTQTNLTASSFVLQANRTAGGSLTATYCRPDCTSPLAREDISARLWVQEIAYANFTTNGSVSTATGTVAAIALENSHATLHGNLSESVTTTARTMMGVSRTASAHLYVTNSGTTSIALTPALGLVPENLSVPSWNSTSTYRASGSWLTTFYYSHTMMSGITSSGQGSVPGSFANATGTVVAHGSPMGAIRLVDGSSTTAVGLQVQGPFVLWEGLILVPAGADLMDPSSGTGWSPYASGVESATTAAVDVGAGGHAAHLPILASATAVSPSSTDSGTVGLTTAFTPLDGPGASVVQGQPETVPYAQSQSQCLVYGCTNGLAAGSRLGWAVPLAVVGAVVAVSLVVVAARQPPRRPAPSPNARLYPPPPRSAARPASPPIPDPGTEPDPLGHLW